MNMFSILLLFIFWILVAHYNLLKGNELFLTVYIFSVLFTVSNVIFLILPEVHLKKMVKYKRFTVNIWALSFTSLTILDLILMLANNGGVECEGYYPGCILFAVFFNFVFLFQILTYALYVKETAKTCEL